MKPSSRAWTFCWNLLLLYVLFVGPGVWIKDVWGRVFREAATSLFKPFPSMTIATMSAFGCKRTANELRPEDTSVQFDPRKEPDRVLDTDMLIIRKNVALAGKLVTLAGRMGVSGWHKCYIPMATIVALVLATPISWRRRLVALLWGIPLVALFILFGLTLTFINGITAGDAIALFELSSVAKKSFSVADHIISRAPVTSSLFPVLIWILVVFQRDNWGEIFGLAAAADKAAT